MWKSWAWKPFQWCEGYERKIETYETWGFPVLKRRQIWSSATASVHSRLSRTLTASRRSMNSHILAPNQHLKLLQIIYPWETLLFQEGGETLEFLRILKVHMTFLIPTAEPLWHLKAIHEIPHIRWGIRLHITYIQKRLPSRCWHTALQSCVHGLHTSSLCYKQWTWTPSDWRECLWAQCPDWKQEAIWSGQIPENKPPFPTGGG